MRVKRGTWIDAGAGPLRVRPNPVKSYGKCGASGCPIVDILYDGLCDWHRWMMNDTEVDPIHSNKAGKGNVRVY